LTPSLALEIVNIDKNLSKIQDSSKLSKKIQNRSKIVKKPIFVLILEIRENWSRDETQKKPKKKALITVLTKFT
jgi:hypothetical protein